MDTDEPDNTTAMGLPTLTTDRLVLRPFAPSDAADVQRMAGSREVASTTLNIPYPYPDVVAEDWIARHADDLAADKSLTLAITLADDGRLVGAVGLTIARRHRRAELGYWIGPAFWGRGYCTEAARALVAYGFERLGLARIVAHHLTRNPASGRVMAKVGMTHEGSLRKHVEKWGAFEDIECYGILKAEVGYDAV